MSRIGKQPVVIPAGTSITSTEGKYVVQGAKGILTVPSFEGVGLEITGTSATAQLENEESKPAYGLLRALLSNAVTGVTEGWKRDLELHGVGMRASLAGSTLNLNLGFSHPVSVEAPDGISFAVIKNLVSVSGIDKQLVGETAAKIRQLRKPEPYKGKGIRFSDEVVRRKAGKTGKAGK